MDVVAGNNVSAAAEALRRGELVVFPTETVYGIGANAQLDDAVKAIYRAKGRPSCNPLIIHVADFAGALTVVDCNQPTIASRLKRLSRLWPGPLTVVAPVNKAVSKVATAGGLTVGVRVPRHPIALALLAAAEVPVAAPSANLSNQVSATTVNHAQAAFGHKVSWYLDGGPCEVGIESTVVAINGDEPLILRPGAVLRSEIEECLGEKVAKPQLAAVKPHAPLTSPGQLPRHYAPQTPLLPLASAALPILDKNSRYGVITVSTPVADLNLPQQPTVARFLGGPESAASSLYATLHEFDALSLDLIAIEGCTADGIGEAIMDRINRAVSVCLEK